MWWKSSKAFTHVEWVSGARGCNIKLMKGKAPRQHSLHEKTAASVLLKPFVSSNEWCHKKHTNAGGSRCPRTDGRPCRTCRWATNGSNLATCTSNLPINNLKWQMVGIFSFFKFCCSWKRIFYRFQTLSDPRFKCILH